MTLALSASTVKAWFQYRCERKTRYDMMSSHDLAAAAVVKDERTPAWAALGDDFEDRVLANLARAAGVRRPNLKGDKLHQSVTAAFLRGQLAETFAAQATLDPGPSVRAAFGLPEKVGLRRSFPDLIQRLDDGGAPIFKVIDIKATRSAATFHKAQVAFYARMLRGLLHDLGIEARIAPQGSIWHVAAGTQPESGRWEEHDFPLDPYLRIVDDFFINDVPVIFRREVTATRDTTFHHLYFKCEQCDYLDHCRRSLDRAAADRDVSAIPGVSHESKRALLARGLRTVGSVAGTGSLIGQEPPPWSLQRRADVLKARARAQVEGRLLRTPDVYSYLMPPRVDHAYFLVADHDPVEDNLVTLGLLCRGPEGDREVIRVVPGGSPSAERDALAEVLGALLRELGAVDAHNEDAAEPDRRHAHIFMYEPAEARSLQAAVGRHLDDPRIRGGLLNAVRLFPPDEVVPEPEFRGIHHLPATALRSVVEQLYALPTLVSYDLRQVTEVLATAGALAGAYAPDARFRRDFSSLLSMEVVRGWRHREGRRFTAEEIRTDVRRRLHATAALADWLWRESARGGDFLRLQKQPFRFQSTIHPLNARDLDLLQAYELLESRSQLLETMVRLALPVRQRIASGRCLGGLTLRGVYPAQRWVTLRFEVPRESRETELSADDIGLIVTDDNPDLRLNQQMWPALEVQLQPPHPDYPGSVMARMWRNRFDDPLIQGLVRATPDGAWCIDQAYKDLNGPRIMNFLAFLDAEDAP